MGVTQEEVTHFEKSENNNGKISTTANTERFYHLQCPYSPNPQNK